MHECGCDAECLSVYEGEFFTERLPYPHVSLGECGCDSECLETSLLACLFLVVHETTDIAVIENNGKNHGARGLTSSERSWIVNPDVDEKLMAT